jgi:pimeloyl-ACP methyl ester carboxylesterase
MATFCLVHGSTQSAAGWDLLVAELTRSGHRTIAPTLSADKPDASAAEYADEVLESLPGDATDVVVVAHSASGLFLPLVAARRRVRQIIFLAAVIPQIGVSFMDQFRSNPMMMNPGWIGQDPTTSDEIAMRFLFHDCTPEIARWALTTRRLMHAKRALTEICPLNRWPDVNSVYIVCADDRTVNPVWWRAEAHDRLGIDPIELSGGHCPHVSRPVAVADALVGSLS